MFLVRLLGLTLGAGAAACALSLWRRCAHHLFGDAFCFLLVDVYGGSVAYFAPLKLLFFLALLALALQLVFLFAGPTAPLDSNRGWHAHHVLRHPFRLLLVPIPWLAHCELGLQGPRSQETQDSLVAERLLELQQRMIQTGWLQCWALCRLRLLLLVCLLSCPLRFHAR